MPIRSLCSVLPKKVKVRFPIRKNYSGINYPIDRYYVSEILLSDAYTNPPEGFNGEKVIFDTAIALYNTQLGPPSNQSILDDLALQIAKDYYNSQDKSFDVIYSGINNIESCSLISELIIDYNKDCCKTRIFTDDFLDYPENFSHWDITANSNKTHDGIPGIRLFSPANLSLESGKTKLALSEAHIIAGRLTKKYKENVIFNCSCEITPCRMVNIGVYCNDIIPPKSIGYHTVHAKLILDGIIIGECDIYANTYCSLPIYEDGFYTVEIDPSTYYQGNSVVVELRCSPLWNNTVAVPLLPIEGYTCLFPCCEDLDHVGGPYPIYEWPETLYFDDGIGLIPCTTIDVLTPGMWVGIATRRASQALSNSAADPPFYLCKNVYNVDVTLYFAIICRNNRLYGSIGFFSAPCGISPYVITETCGTWPVWLYVTGDDRPNQCNWETIIENPYTMFRGAYNVPGGFHAIALWGENGGETVKCPPTDILQTGNIKSISTYNYPNYGDFGLAVMLWGIYGGTYYPPGILGPYDAVSINIPYTITT